MRHRSASRVLHPETFIEPLPLTGIFVGQQTNITFPRLACRAMKTELSAKRCGRCGLVEITPQSENAFVVAAPRNLCLTETSSALHLS